MVDIRANLQNVRGEINETALACGRDPASVRLLAVSKTFGADAINLAASVGQKAFGENRVQEAESKIPLVKSPGIEWHLIGHLQSNKARRAVELFDVVQSVDSEKLARVLDRNAAEQGKRLPVCLEVNVGEEAQKSGVLPSELRQLITIVGTLNHLEVRGLMAIPPWSDDPEMSRPYFRRLAGLLNEINRSLAAPLTQLSMGMSHDFKVAIQEGSTLVRVGTAIFGKREANG
ncbi:MAG: YggS family pyridoxal phosphate-dependent enzyme [Acidobacteria bacterium]|nr:MAG: YggS family pyridoxal phosphate-dependent enzyme [Acidobacteriota bacterium]